MVSNQNLDFLNYVFDNSTSNNSNNRKEKKLPPSRQRVKENSRLLPQKAIEIMTEWYDRNYSNPYPTYRDCEILAQLGQITVNQVKQWFVNIRRRTHNQFRKTRDTRSTKRKQAYSPDIPKKKRLSSDDLNNEDSFQTNYSFPEIQNNSEFDHNCNTYYNYEYRFDQPSKELISINHNNFESPVLHLNNFNSYLNYNSYDYNFSASPNLLDSQSNISIYSSCSTNLSPVQTNNYSNYNYNAINYFQSSPTYFNYNYD